jgi:hypothetical protein
MSANHKRIKNNGLAWLHSTMLIFNSNYRENEYAVIMSCVRTFSKCLVIIDYSYVFFSYCPDI